jgi:hypothetical protein
MQFGEPYAQGFGQSVVYQIVNYDVVKSYIGALLKPAERGAKVDLALLDQLCSADTMSLKDVVLGFFSAATSKPSAKTATS